jgi:hypothetical protein
MTVVRKHSCSVLRSLTDRGTIQPFFSRTYMHHYNITRIAPITLIPNLTKVDNYESRMQHYRGTPKYPALSKPSSEACVGSNSDVFGKDQNDELVMGGLERLSEVSDVKTAESWLLCRDGLLTTGCSSFCGAGAAILTGSVGFLLPFSAATWGVCTAGGVPSSVGFCL